jgi:hypothetical protein
MLTVSICLPDQVYELWLTEFTGSYMYVGLAVRTALAMGINREPSPQSKKPVSQLKAEARTWWYVSPGAMICLDSS